MDAWRPTNTIRHRARRRGPNNKGGMTMTINPTYLKVLQETLDELSPRYIRKVIIYAVSLLKIQREREDHHDDEHDNDDDDHD